MRCRPTIPGPAAPLSRRRAARPFLRESVNIQRPTLNAQHSTARRAACASHWTLDVERWTLNVGRWWIGALCVLALLGVVAAAPSISAPGAQSKTHDQTDYANIVPDNTAAVTATSVTAGNATLNLTVTFLDTDYSTIPTGDYAVTVTGTLTAN